MRQVLPPANASFNAAAGTITFSNTIPASISHVLRVTNLDRAVVYFDPTNPTNSGVLSGAAYVSPVLTLKGDTSAHSNADRLYIEYDDGQGLANLELTGPITLSGEVEVKNDSGSPIPASVAAVGATDDAPASSDGGTFSVVALLKRLLGKLPALTNGAVPVAPNVQQGGGAITASTTRVTLATDGPGLAALTSLDNKAPAARTPTTTSVASSTTSVLLLAANANRRGLSIYNESTAILRISNSNPATNGNHFATLQPGGFYAEDLQAFTTGAIHGIWSAANGSAQVRELT